MCIGIHLDTIEASRQLKRKKKMYIINKPTLFVDSPFFRLFSPLFSYTSEVLYTRAFFFVNDKWSGKRSSILYTFTLYTFTRAFVYMYMPHPLPLAAHTNHPKSHRRARTIYRYTTRRQYRHCANRNRFFTFVHIHLFRYICPNDVHTHNITCADTYII